MIQSTYKTTFPVWTEKNLQVMRGVEIATDIPLLVYRFTHNRSQKQQIENDLLQFEGSGNLYLPIQTEYVQRDLFTYDILIVGSNGQRLFQSPLKNSMVQLYQIFLAYDSLYRLYSSRGIGMRDITIYNIILDQQMNIKVVDFGLFFQQFLELQAANVGRAVLFQNFSIYWPPEVLFGYARQSWEYSLGMIYFILLTSIERENQIKEIIKHCLRSRSATPSSLRQSIYTYIMDYGRKIISQYQMMMILGLMGYQKPILWNNIPNQPMFSQNLECIRFKKLTETTKPVQQLCISQLPSLRLHSPQVYQNENINRPVGQSTSNKSEFMSTRKNQSQYEQQSSIRQSSPHGGRVYIQRNQSQRTISQYTNSPEQSTKLTLSQLLLQRSKSTSSLNSLKALKIERPHHQNTLSQSQRPQTVIKQKSNQSIIRPQSLKSTYATATDTEATSEVQAIRPMRRKRIQAKPKENSLDNIFQQKESSESQENDTPKRGIQKFADQKISSAESVLKKIEIYSNQPSGRELIIERGKDIDESSLQQTLQLLQKLQITSNQDKIIIRKFEDISPISSNTSLLKRCTEEYQFSRQQSSVSPLLSPIPQVDDSKEEMTHKTIPSEQLVRIFKAGDMQTQATPIQSSFSTNNKINIQDVPEINIRKASEQSEQDQRKRSLFEVRPVPIQTNSKISQFQQQQVINQVSKKHDISILVQTKEDEQPSQPLKSILKNTYSPITPIRQDDFSMIMRDYSNQLSQYDLIGQCVLNAIDYLKNSKSMWIFPLFMVFKRMFQQRKEIEKQMLIPTDFLGHENFEAFSQSKQFQTFLQQIQEENGLIEQDFKKLLRAALFKTKDFDPRKLDKIKWFLNEDISQKLQDQCFIYLYSQILPHVKQQLKLSQTTVKPEITPLEWNRLILQILATLIITENPVMSVPLDQFDYDIFINEYMNYTKTDQIEIIISNMESTINVLKQRLVQKGFKI